MTQRRRIVHFQVLACALMLTIAPKVSATTHDNSQAASGSLSTCAAGPSISTGRLGLVFCASSDGFGLTSIFGRRAVTGPLPQISQPVRMQGPANELWELTLVSTVNPDRTPIKLDNHSGLGVTLAHHSSATRLTLIWQDISLQSQGGPGTLTVTVDLHARSDDAIESWISVDLDSSDWSLAEVTFPRLRRITVPSAETSVVAPIGSAGTRITQPWQAPFAARLFKDRYSYPSRNFTMQWFAIDHGPGRPSLYVAVEDPSASVKSFYLCGDQSAVNPCDEGTSRPPRVPGVGADIVFIPPGVGCAGNDFSMNRGGDLSGRLGSCEQLGDGHQGVAGPVVIALQEGTWFDFASRYRKFASSAPWSRRGPIALRPDHPSWMREAGFLSPHSGRSLVLDGTSQTSALRDLVGGDGALIWHYSGWDPSQRAFCDPSGAILRQDNDMPFPEHSGPLESNASAAEGAGVPTAIYMNTFSLDLVNADLSNGCSCERPWLDFGIVDLDTVAVINSDGERRDNEVPPPEGSSVCNPSQAQNGRPESTTMTTCPFSARWKQMFDPSTVSASDPASNLFDTFLRGASGSYPEINGVYLDVVAAASPRICYSQEHGHAPGGGNHWVEGHRTVARGARSSLLAGGLTEPGLYTESFAEPYVDELNGFLTVDAIASVDPLPLSMAVYHGNTQFLSVLNNLSLPSEGTQSVVAKQGLMLSWGGMPGFVLGQKDLDSRPREHLGRLATTHRNFRRFLVDGVMQSPPVVRVSSGFGRGTTAKMPIVETTVLDPLRRGQSLELRHPAVAVSSWASRTRATTTSSAEQSGILLVSLLERGIILDLQVDLVDAWQRVDLYAVAGVNDVQLVQTLRLNGAQQDLDVRVAPLDVIFAVITVLSS